MVQFNISSFVHRHDLDRLTRLVNKSNTYHRFVNIYGGSNSGKTTFLEILDDLGTYRVPLEFDINNITLPRDKFIIIEEDDFDESMMFNSINYSNITQNLYELNSIIIYICNYDITECLSNGNDRYFTKIHFPFNFTKILNSQPIMGG